LSSLRVSELGLDPPSGSRDNPGRTLHFNLLEINPRIPRRVRPLLVYAAPDLGVPQNARYCMDVDSAEWKRLALGTAIKGPKEASFSPRTAARRKASCALKMHTAYGLTWIQAFAVQTPP
jgi:hypothetical protein